MERDSFVPRRLPLEGQKLTDLVPGDAVSTVLNEGFLRTGTTYVSEDVPTAGSLDIYRVSDQSAGFLLSESKLPEPFLGRMTGLPRVNGGSFSIWNVSDRSK